MSKAAHFASWQKI